jgi:hypothetical protein
MERSFVSEMRMSMTAKAAGGSGNRRAVLRWLGAIAVLVGSIALVACAGEEPEPEPPSVVEVPPEPRVHVDRGEPLPEEEARAALATLSGASAAAANQAIARIRAAGDTRFIAAFIELMQASRVGVASPGVVPIAVESLEDLSGEAFGGSWPDWIEWYASTDLEPPPGFTAWKGDLLGRIDPSFAEILFADAPSRIRVEEVVWGGVLYEGIPALDHPKTVSADAADYLQAEEPVFGIELGGAARAYPLRILDWHEMANDTLGGVRFSLAYCTLCSAGIPYAALASDGVSYDFGSSGLLMRSNKLMVDRQTRSLWNQFTGRPVLGPLADTEVHLDRLPVVVATWQVWKARHPDTTVLSIDTGFERDYGLGAAYGGYFESDETMFPVRTTRTVLEQKQRVFGIELGGVAKAYALDELIYERVINDELGGWPLVLVATSSEIRVSGKSQRKGEAHYTAGATVRAYTGTKIPVPFSMDERGRVLDMRGIPWKVTEEALVGTGGERAERLAGVLSYWFAWNAYHPQTLVYGETQ